MRIIRLLLLMLPFHLFSQNTFVKEYSTPLKDIGKEIHINSDSTFILECHRIDDNNLQNESTYFYEINSNGDIIRENSFPFNLNKIFKKSSGGYVFIGDSFDGKMVIGDLSQNLVVDTIVEYDFGNYEYSSVDAIISDSGFIITSGTIADGLFKETILHKINLNLDTIKARTLDIIQSGNYATSEVSHRIFHVNDSSIYLIGYKAFIVRLNSNLDTLSVFDNQNTDILSILNFDVCLHNDTLIVLSYGATGTGYVISKVTKDLDVISSKYIDLYPIWEYTPHKLLKVDDAFYTTGFIKVVNDSLERQICISKLNNDFDTVWCRKFGGPFNDNSYDIVLTSDSSLMVIGETQTGLYNNAVDMILIKADLSGQVIGGTGFVCQKDLLLRVYPNPAMDKIFLNSTNQKRMSGLRFQLYDQSGKKILEQQLDGSLNENIIDISWIVPGIYLYKLIENTSTFQSDVIIIQ